MTIRRDQAKLREVADHHAADDPALAAQLYADADYLAQLHKASTNVNGDNVWPTTTIPSTGLLMQDRDAPELDECVLLLIETHPLESREASRSSLALCRWWLGSCSGSIFCGRSGSSWSWWG